MSISGIHGQLLEVTVVGCNKLKDTEWISRQDPYVCLEYGSTKYRTRTHTDGGKNPVFQEKFVFTLVEGLRELNVVVWNSNTMTYDDFIGSGKIQLQKVLSEGYDDTFWTIHSKTGRYAGEVKLVLHYSRPSKLATGHAPSAPPFYGVPNSPQVPQYPMQQPAPASYGHPPASYLAPSPYPAYPPLPSAYPPAPSAYPPAPSAYPPPPSAYPPAPSSYPPQYAPPPSAYPPAPYPYPPPDQSYYPPGSGSYPGVYPRPPY